MRKVSAISLLESVLFSNSDPSKVSLNDMAIYHHLHYGSFITRQAIAKRFNKKATDFAVSLLKQILQTKLSGLGVLFSKTVFNRVLIRDSTCYQLPENLSEYYPGSGGSGSNSAVRIQFEYDLLSNNIQYLQVSAFNRQDSHNAKETLTDIYENDLIIRDLGYVNIETLQGIEKRKAWFISRLNPNITVYTSDKREPIDFYDIARALESKAESIEKSVLLGEKEYPVRLVIEKVPERVKQERLRKAAIEGQKKGKKVSKEKKIRMELNLFITNCPASILSASELRRIYGIRWQIELIFKAWKQNSQFHKIKKMNVNRYEFLLYAKLIWIVLHWKIYQVLDLSIYKSKRLRISILKVFKSLQHQFQEELKDFIRGSNVRFNKIINEMLIMAEYYWLHDDRKDRINWRNVQII